MFRPIESGTVAAPSTTRALRPDVGGALTLFVLVLLALQIFVSDRVDLRAVVVVVFGTIISLLLWMIALPDRDLRWLRAHAQRRGGRWSAEERSVTVVEAEALSDASYRAAESEPSMPSTTTYFASHAPGWSDLPGATEVARNCRVRPCHRVVRRGVLFETTSTALVVEHVRVRRPGSWFIERMLRDGAIVITEHPSLEAVIGRLGWEIEASPERLRAALTTLEDERPMMRIEVEDEPPMGERHGPKKRRGTR